MVFNSAEAGEGLAPLSLRINHADIRSLAIDCHMVGGGCIVSKSCTKGDFTTVALIVAADRECITRQYIVSVLFYLGLIALFNSG